MNYRDRTQLERIREEIKFIKRATAAAEKESFLKDEVLQHAMCMSLLTIGECANHLSEEFTSLYPEVAWIQIIAVRNLAAHGYWQLDMRQIWQAIQKDIPELEEFLQKL